MPSPSLVVDETEKLLDWARRVREETDTPFERTSHWVKRMGAQVREDGLVEIGIWAPDLDRKGVDPSDAVLEVLTPPPDLDLTAPKQHVTFRRDTVSLRAQDDILWGVVDGMRPGTRGTVGSFYWVRYPDVDGTWRPIYDELAASVPFGAFAPAELYDSARIQHERADRAYWESLSTEATKNDRPQIDPPDHILQLHPGTSSEPGTIAGLTRIYQEIARKQEASEPLTPEEEPYAGYDAVQLMPVEPIIEYETGDGFWQEEGGFDPDAEAVTVQLHAPDMTNWGYDIVISASSAVNPVILESKRPDELVDFAATLHTMPNGPIQLIFDVVYGHVDNQAVGLLPDEFLAGPGMYGMNLDYQNPMVRSLLLEMQRRKVNFGADGVRTDGAQDFKYWDPETQQLYHDDEYLQQMSDLVQEVNGTQYYPWMIFEDGRPWPQDDWELSSTYRSVIEQQPDVFQWGPLTFAHNTPFVFTFWISRWWRIQEILKVGGHWISGCANHDTLRRGSQVDPEDRVNTFLGDSLPEIIENAYDNPAANMLTYGFFPGVPMDFVNAFMHTPWSFIRNTDDRYGVKVASEEARFLDWRVTGEDYANEAHFTRLKTLGFTTRAALHRFMHTLDAAVQMTDDDLPGVVSILKAMDPPLAGPELSVDALKTVARAWMDDVHAYCNVAHHTHRMDGDRTAYNRALRAFRSERPWLMDDVGPDDLFRYREPAEGTILFYGLRKGPAGAGDVAFVGNMEGAPTEVVPVALLPKGERDGWQVALTPPDLSDVQADAPVTLPNSRALLLTRNGGE